MQPIQDCLMDQACAKAQDGSLDVKPTNYSNLSENQIVHLKNDDVILLLMNLTDGSPRCWVDVE